MPKRATKIDKVIAAFEAEVDGHLNAAKTLRDVIDRLRAEQQQPALVKPHEPRKPRKVKASAPTGE